MHVPVSDKLKNQYYGQTTVSCRLVVRDYRVSYDKNKTTLPTLHHRILGGMLPSNQVSQVLYNSLHKYKGMPKLHSKQKPTEYMYLTNDRVCCQAITLLFLSVI